MKRTYYIDSENVGSKWIPILLSSEDEDEFLVFYTEKSPHIGYEMVRALKESPKTPTFIKCFEGNNALDFQLVTELGYRLQDSDVENIIVTNDTGFDAVVKYWSAKEMKVTRIPCNEKKVEPASAIAPINPEENTDPFTASAPEIVRQADSPSIQIKKGESTREQDILKVVTCIGKENLPDLHNSLVHLFGANDAKDIYKRIKDDVAHKGNSFPVQPLNKQKKIEIYSKLVFEYNSIGSKPNDFASFICGLKEKKDNLNSFRAALTAKYGKDTGTKYYSAFKTHIKLMNKF